MTKTKLWWASVGGNHCEPIRVGTEAGKDVFYSIGCTDPHPLNGVILVKEIDSAQIPLSPKETEARRKAREEEFERAKRFGNLSYRRF